jgi:hypothetical protein
MIFGRTHLTSDSKPDVSLEEESEEEELGQLPVVEHELMTIVWLLLD